MLFEIYSKNIITNYPHFSKLIRFIAKHTLNTIMPIAYTLDTVNDSPQCDIIVSLTTFPKRIHRTHIVIQSILHQKIRPKKIVLTLSRQQFTTENSLPKKLRCLIEKNLVELIWTSDDLRSHKKYYYVMKSYPNEVIVTIDDDVIYESSFLEVLLKYHQLYPQCIIANTAVEKNPDSYNTWKSLFFDKKEPSYSILPIGVGGVLYPPKSLHNDVWDKSLMMELCPLADDIWLNAMACLKNTLIVKTDYKIHPLPLLLKNNETLHEKNLGENMNDKQILKLEQFYNKDVLIRK